MDVLQFGPLAVAADRLLAIVALWAFVRVVSYSRRLISGGGVRASWFAVAAGVVAARIGFVAQNRAAFAVDPWTIVYLWQGGFSPIAGLGTAVVVLLVMLRSKERMLALASLFIVSTVWFTADRLIQPDARPLPSSLAMQDLSGQTVELGKLRGQPFVINLWATWCGPCQREMPMLLEVARTNRDVPVLMINQGEDAERVLQFLEGEGLSSDVVYLDLGGSVGLALGSSALPTTAFVSSDGQIVDVHIGEISRAALVAALEELRQARRE